MHQAGLVGKGICTRFGEDVPKNEVGAVDGPVPEPSSFPLDSLRFMNHAFSGKVSFVAHGFVRVPTEQSRTACVPGHGKFVSIGCRSGRARG